MSIRRSNGLFISSSEVVRSMDKLVMMAGVPNAPVLTVDSVTGNLSWTAATGSGGPVLGYAVTVDPPGPTVTIAGTSATVTNYTPGFTYTFTVMAINNSGVGVPSVPKTITIGFNAATGGSESDVTNYQSSGQTWRLHTFTSSGTLTVTSAFLPFNILLVANGNGGGGTQGGPAGGGAGGRVLSTSGALGSGALSVVIGGNTTIPGYSSASGTQAGQATPGPTSSVGGTSTHYGGGGGAGGPASPSVFPNIHTGPAGQPGGAGGGGAGGRGGTDGQSANGWGGAGGDPGTNGLGGGGGGAGGYFANNWGGFTPGGSGGSGRAIIAYRIA